MWVSILFIVELVLQWSVQNVLIYSSGCTLVQTVCCIKDRIFYTKQEQRILRKGWGDFLVLKDLNHVHNIDVFHAFFLFTYSETTDSAYPKK